MLATYKGDIMTYTEVYDLVILAIGDMKHEADMLQAKCESREWARAKAYTMAMRRRLVQIDALIDTANLIDRERPPTNT